MAVFAYLLAKLQPDKKWQILTPLVIRVSLMKTDRQKPLFPIYEIKTKGHLDEQWADLFAPLRLKHTDDGHTILVGPISDQAALQGILISLSNLNLELISVNQSKQDGEQSVEQGKS